MQPAFLPWAGFFNLISEVDAFVFLDDVQLEKQSWQTRNRVLVSGKAHWVSVPIRHQRVEKTILKTSIDETKNWRRKLARTFEQNYGRHQYFDDASSIIDLAHECVGQSLAEMNTTIAIFVANRLGFSPRFHLASNLNAAGVRSQRLTEICKIIQADKYLSPIGSAEYLAEDRFTELSGVELSFQDFIPGTYPQRSSSEFVSHLSIVDVVANIGWEAATRYVCLGAV